MEIVKNIYHLNQIVTELKKKGKTIGFVPTMGALHKGHISLINEAGKQCDIKISSVFVNPTQFNDKKDLDRYPRTPEADIALLEREGCDIVFFPQENEIYPEKEDKRVFYFGRLEELHEGHARPGHFNGVAQVVSKLFELVKPDKAFFGQKDYQQVMVVKALVKQMNYPVEIISCPIIREPDGLAMSSRNVLLSPDERKVAAKIPLLMKEMEELVRKNVHLQNILIKIKEEITQQTLMSLDYLEICNANNLEPISTTNGIGHVVALIAVFVGKIRLIDNVILK